MPAELPPERAEWRLRRADDFPAFGGAPNRALCCTSTCCCLVVVGAGVGVLVGGTIGLVRGVQASRAIAKSSGSRSGTIVLAGVGGFLLARLFLPMVEIVASSGWIVLAAWIVPFLAAAAAAYAASRSPASGKALASTGAILGGIFLGAFLGAIVLGGIGLMLDMSFGTFK